MQGFGRERSSVKARDGQSQADRRAIAVHHQKAKRREGVDEARQMGIEEGGEGAAQVMQGQPFASEAAAPEPPLVGAFAGFVAGAEESLVAQRRRKQKGKQQPLLPSSLLPGGVDLRLLRVEEGVEGPLAGLQTVCIMCPLLIFGAPPNPCT